MRRILRNIYSFLSNNKATIFSLIFLSIILLLAGSIAWPNEPSFFGKDIKAHLGLDLQGGVQITYKADTSGIPKADQAQALKSLTDVIDRRINALGVSEPTIQSANSSPYSQNPQWAKTGLEGKDLKKALVTFPQNNTKPQISIYFNNNGKKLFSEITKRNLQKPLAIFLDGELVSAPIVQTEITQGEAVITGDFTIKSANNLAIQLNAGALPVPISVAEQRTIGPTLGEISIKQSLLAGFMGIVLIVWFMVANYKLSGVIASIALGIYGLVNIALYKVIPVTLTLAGIAGFILSLGMAVDANVLIFERLKEEIRKGENLKLALENGFQRAWTSIRDSNVSSLITTAILFWFGSGSVKGFALTLGIGVLVSMFSAITLTRMMMRILVSMRILRDKPHLFHS